VLAAGDELLMVDTTYGPTRAFCDTVLKRFGVSTRYYDPMAGAGIADLIGEKTRAIFLESPGTYTFEVQDIPAICAVAKARGITTLIDNTWATPLYLPAIELGVDVSIVACTKYIGGHADLMLGSVTVTEPYAARLERTRRVLGQTAGPDDAWLALRGLRTLAVRLARHQESALKVAHWLAGEPKVARVLHPALPDCPGHDLWKRDFKGATGLFSFVLNGGDAAAQTRLIESLTLFGIGYSWGAFESLALPGHFTRTVSGGEYEGPMVRLHIGLEDPDDLIDDLAAALADYPG
jgi:cystathionine beta-lyase